MLRLGASRLRAARLSPSTRASSSSSQSAKPLAITLPDLSEAEERYIRSQLDLIRRLRPDHLKAIDIETAKVYVRQEFPSFLTGSKKSAPTAVYNNLTFNAAVTLRTVAALAHLDAADDEQVKAQPSHLAQKLPFMFSNVHHMHILNVPLLEVPKKRYKQPLRGRAIHEMMDELCETLVAVDMIGPDAVKAFENARLAPTNSGFLTMRDLQLRALKALIKTSYPDNSKVPLLQMLQSVDRKTKCSHASSLCVRRLVRNQWMFSRLFFMHPDQMLTETTFTRMLFHVCPVESLICVNDLYEAVAEGDETMTPEKFLERMQASRHYVMFPSQRFPLSLRLKVLEEVGFSRKEAVEIVLSQRRDHKHFSDLSTARAPKSRLKYNSPEYVPEMRRRLDLLRDNAEQLSYLSAADCFEALTNWDDLLGSVRGCLESGGGRRSLFRPTRRTSPSVVKYIDSSDSRGNIPATKFLLDYFGETQAGPSGRQFTADMHVSQAQKSVSWLQVKRTLQLLEREGFSKPQMRRALPLLFYDPSLVSECLASMRERDELDLKDERVLQLCLYHVEKQFDFSSDGFYLGFRPELTAEMMAEVRGAEKEENLEEKFCPTIVNEESQDDIDQDEDYGAYADPYSVPYKSVPLQRSPFARGSLTKTGVRLLHTSSAQERSKGIQFVYVTRKGKMALYALPNPVRHHSVLLEFNRVKREWDPNMEYESFVEASKQALAAVSTMLQEHRYEDLKPLMSKRGHEKVKIMAETQWDELTKNTVGIDPEDIMVAWPSELKTREMVDMRLCTISVVFVAHKKITPSQALFYRYDVRLFNDYSKGAIPNWVFSHFEVERLEPVLHLPF